MTDPMELLTNKYDHQHTWLHDKWSPMFGVTSGFLAALFINWANRRPLMSGIQRHIGLSVGGGLLGRWLDIKTAERAATRDAVLRHYLELHPEDFPPKERKKYADVLEKWIPIR